MACRKIILFLTVLVVVLSCGDAGVRRAVKRAEKLVDSCPREAFAVLDSVRPQAMQTGLSQRSRYLLLRQLARHLMWEPIEADTLLMEAVAYTNQHGTPNERLTANYLLGYGFAENNWTAEAQQAFFRAIESADTTARDCDFSRLAKTYAQKAQLYINRTDPTLMLEDAQKAKHFAHKKNDSILILSCDAEIALAYYLKGDYLNSLKINKKVFNDFLIMGDSVWAGGTARQVAKDYLQTNELDSAAFYIQFYEQNFIGPDNDRQDDINRYFSLKGQYFAMREEYDSAFCYYHKSIHFGGINQKIGAYEKLKNLFKELNQLDSALHYSEAFINLRDQYESELKNSQLQKLHVRFDYDRVSKQLENKTRQNNYLLIAIIVILLIASLICSLYYIRISRHKQERKQLMLKFRALQLELGELKEKGKSTAIIEDDIAMVAQDMTAEEKWEVSMESLRLKAEYKELLQVLTSRKHISGELSQAICEEIVAAFPYHTAIVPSLTSQEKNIYLFTLIGVSPSQLAELLSITPQGVSNIRKKLNERLYGIGNPTQNFFRNIKSNPQG